MGPDLFASEIVGQEPAGSEIDVNAFPVRDRCRRGRVAEFVGLFKLASRRHAAPQVLASLPVRSKREQFAFRYRRQEDVPIP